MKNSFKSIEKTKPCQEKKGGEALSYRFSDYCLGQRVPSFDDIVTRGIHAILLAKKPPSVG